jgi:hypothetical protein
VFFLGAGGNESVKRLSETRGIETDLPEPVKSLLREAASLPVITGQVLTWAKYLSEKAAIRVLTVGSVSARSRFLRDVLLLTVL